MEFSHYAVNPFRFEISFQKVVDTLEQIAQSDVDYRALYAKGLLKEVYEVPELLTGIHGPELLKKHEALIKNLLADLFPTALTHNEIKAATIPFHQVVFNPTERFRKILERAGADFEINFRPFNPDQFYVLSCCMILKKYYGYDIDFSQPVIYDIPIADGTVRHYRLLYNADFLEIVPSEDSLPIQPSDVEFLLDRAHDIDLWKMKFPPNSWILRGFGIMTLFDNTIDSAINQLKENLFRPDPNEKATLTNFEEIFRSIFGISNLKLGFTQIHSEENKFSPIGINLDIPSFLTQSTQNAQISDVLCSHSVNCFLKEFRILAISDLEKHAQESPDESRLAQYLLAQGFQSCILAPIVKNEQLFGIMELLADQKHRLNSVNATKLDYVLPFIADTMERYHSQHQNTIDALIQKEYTSIHPSVYWKFRAEAERHTIPGQEDLPFREIVFQHVYPLYGQIDVKGSSQARNSALVADLGSQIGLLTVMLESLLAKNPLPLIEQHLYELNKFRRQLNSFLKADTEINIQTYLVKEVHPLLEHFKDSDPNFKQQYLSYQEQLDSEMQVIYRVRRDFDQALSLINKKMAGLLDRKQLEAQAYFPHYYERFKTDGVEYNLYIGASIAPHLPYNPIYLGNLRLWQLQASVDMEIEYAKLRPNLPYDLEVASLILLFSSPISIRFRMDEKRFDVDGTYNARYEVVKKRIDKAKIKGSDERITRPGYVTVVFTQDQEELEYRRYIKLLQYKGQLGSEIRVFDIQDLQGITGLKAIQVQVIPTQTQETYTYDDLIKELNEVS